MNIYNQLNTFKPFISLDSRGNYTNSILFNFNGVDVISSCPSGASCGELERIDMNDRFFIETFLDINSKSFSSFDSLNLDTKKIANAYIKFILVLCDFCIKNNFNISLLNGGDFEFDDSRMNLDNILDLLLFEYKSDGFKLIKKNAFSDPEDSIFNSIDKISLYIEKKANLLNDMINSFGDIKKDKYLYYAKSINILLVELGIIVNSFGFNPILENDKGYINIPCNITLPISISFFKYYALCNEDDLHSSILSFFKRQYHNAIVDNNKHSFKMLFNVINGGKHSSNNIDVQEFMLVVSVVDPSLSKSPNMDIISAARLCIKLLRLDLEEKGLSTAVGDEGGFAPNFNSHSDILDTLTYVIDSFNSLSSCSQGCVFGNIHIGIALDVASNSFSKLNSDSGLYDYIFEGAVKSSEELLGIYKSWISKYKIDYIEDPFHENDKKSWKSLLDLVKSSNKNTVIVGDDLFATNPILIDKGVNSKIANGVIIKPNQIGTIGMALKSVFISMNNSAKVIISHRSGESEDDFISSLALGVLSDYIKFGSLARSERLVKYNKISMFEQFYK